MWLNRFKRFLVEAAIVALLSAADINAQSTLLLDDDIYQALIDETSGETALTYFDDLVEFSGWSPSLGADQTADYLVGKARSFGLQDSVSHSRMRWVPNSSSDSKPGSR